MSQEEIKAGDPCIINVHGEMWWGEYVDRHTTVVTGGKVAFTQNWQPIRSDEKNGDLVYLLGGVIAHPVTPESYYWVHMFLKERYNLWSQARELSELKQFVQLLGLKKDPSSPG